MVKDVESVTWANINTDHFPLEVTVALKLAAGPKKGKQTAGPSMTSKKWTKKRGGNSTRGWRSVPVKFAMPRLRRRPGDI